MGSDDEQPLESRETPGSDALLQLILGGFLVIIFCGVAWLMFWGR